MPSDSCEVLYRLYEVILERKRTMPEGSYTAKLFAKGKPYIAQKVGEEAVETTVAYLAETKERVISESADLVYHWLVMLADSGITLDDVMEELRRRMK